MPARKVVLAVDDSACSFSALHWACANLVRPDDDVHLVAVTAPVAMGTGMYPALPMSTAGAVATGYTAYHEEHAREEERCKAVLVRAKKALAEARRGEAHTHCLPPSGGASGVAESIVAWAAKERADVVVIGSRGMSAVRSTLMSLVGLGSVSAYCLHHLACPVCVVRGKGQEAPRKPVNKVLVPVDDSRASQRALWWAIDNVLGPQDELHIVSVEPAEAIAATGVEGAPLKVLDHAGAQETVSAAVEEAATKVDRRRIRYKALEPEGGASGVGLSIKHYAEANGVDMAVVGSRGMGAVKRALQSLVGLGSVSEWCTRNLDCPITTVKQ